MKQIFVKTIQGHEVEFSRLLYPLRYQIFIRSANSNPTIVTLIKDTKQGWILANPDQAPAWVNEMDAAIHNAIDENEAKDTKQKK